MRSAPFFRPGVRQQLPCLLLALSAVLTGLQLPAQIGGVDVSFDPGANVAGNVWTIAPQSDGKVIIGGTFTSINGVARNRIARLNPDGSLDTSFNPGTGANKEVQVVRLDASGRVLIGGNFATFNGTNRAGIARLNRNGSLDTSFNPGSGANAPVWAIVVQPDGKVLLGGGFTFVNGNSRNGIARLTSTGAIDDTFAPGTAATNGTIYALAVQGNGRIVIGGTFTSYAGMPRTNLARLNINGTIDGTFNPGGGAGGAGNVVNALALQSDGKVIAGGDFTTFDGVTRNYLARLGTNGALDLTFNAAPDLTVRSVAVQADDRILIGGDFYNVSGNPRLAVARLLSHGSLDTTFDSSAGADDTVETIAVQADGRVFVGGWFNNVSGLARSRIARLHITPSGLSPKLTGTRTGNNFNVAFASLTNTAYLLEYNDSLSTRAWLPLALLFGDGAIKSFIDPHPGVPQRFYRVRTLYSEPYLLHPLRVGSTFSVTVPAFAWRTMFLEYKNSLSDLTWTSLPGVPGDNTIKSLSDPTATASTRHYRVRAQ